MNIWFTLLLVLFLILVVLFVGGISIIAPQIGLLIIASLAFGLFAFRLLSTYVLVISTADLVKEGKEVTDFSKLAQKSGKTEEEVKRIPISALLALIMTTLEPYRYTFYFGFVIILLITLVVGSLPLYNEFKTYTEALFWGTALTTFIVWAFESFATASVEELAEIEAGQTQNTQ